LDNLQSVRWRDTWKSVKQNSATVDTAVAPLTKRSKVNGAAGAIDIQSRL
jgi:allantoicase